jgi:hypothetical protein
MNAAAFMLLAPGIELSSYLSVSVIYNTAAWLMLWIAPSMFAFDKDKINKMRSMQLMILFTGILLLLVMSRSFIGLIFSALLLAEYIFFFPSILLYEEKSRNYQIIELARSILNAFSILLTWKIAGGSPLVYCGLLLCSAVVVGLFCMIIKLVNIYKIFYSLGYILNSFRNVLPQCKERNFLALLVARILDITVMQVFAILGEFGMQISYKIGISLAQPISSNAREKSSYHLLFILSVAYMAGLLMLHFIDAYKLIPMPKTVHLIDPYSIVTVWPLILISSSLLFKGLRLRG